MRLHGSNCRGLVHVHSTYSYDGHHTVQELGEFGRKRGYGFICLTEHSDTMDDGKMDRLVEECKRHSDERVKLIPGVEFTCGEYHILGVGIERFRAVEEPLRAIEFIKDQRGIAILAHPGRYGYSVPEEVVRALDGIEVWNMIYDGRFVPDPEALRWVKGLMERGLKVMCYGGADLHRITNSIKVETYLLSQSSGKEAVVEALKDGAFLISNSWITLNSYLSLSRIGMGQIKVERYWYRLLKGLRDRFHTYLGRVGAFLGGLSVV